MALAADLVGQVHAESPGRDVGRDRRRSDVPLPAPAATGTGTGGLHRCTGLGGSAATALCALHVSRVVKTRVWGLWSDVR